MWCCKGMVLCCKVMVGHGMVWYHLYVWHGLVLSSWPYGIEQALCDRWKTELPRIRPTGIVRLEVLHSLQKCCFHSKSVAFTPKVLYSPQKRSIDRTNVANCIDWLQIVHSPKKSGLTSVAFPPLFLHCLCNTMQGYTNHHFILFK